MKKTFTLLAIATVLTTASFAQYDRPHGNYDRDREIAATNNRDGYGHGRERGTYFFSAKDKEAAIYSINNEYRRKIESVKHRFFMGRAKKEQILYSLEMQRSAEIRNVISKFNDRRNLYDRRDDWGHDRGRKNNW